MCLIERHRQKFRADGETSDVDYSLYDLRCGLWVTGSPFPLTGVKRGGDASVVRHGSATVKARGHDTISFYSLSPGLPNPSWGSRPMILFAYRITAQNKRVAHGEKGLLWNGATPTSSQTPPACVFMPIPARIAASYAELRPSQLPDP